MSMEHIALLSVGPQFDSSIGVTDLGNVSEAYTDIETGPDHKTWFTFVINFVIMGIISVFGLICNGLSMVTLQKDRHKVAMTVLLQGLAVSDSLFLVYTLFYSTLRTSLLYGEVTETGQRLSDIIIAYVLPFGWIAQTTSIWIVTFVTVDRYFAICHPFKSKRYSTMRSAKYTLLTVWILSAAFNFPRFVYYHYVTFSKDNQNSTSIFVAHSDFTLEIGVNYHTIYHIFLTIIFLFVIPLPIIISLNIRLFKEIRFAKKREKMFHLGQKCKDNIRATINLVAVVCVFVICETPDFVACILKISWIYRHLHPDMMDYFLSIKELLLVINAATNFLIYCMFYERFRKLLKVVCCRSDIKEVYAETKVPFLMDERHTALKKNDTQLTIDTSFLP